MSHVSPARATLALFALSATLAGCKVKDPLYCDESTPCTDPALPFCDLDGVYPASDGIKRTCIAYPWDGSPGGDAGPSCTPGEWVLDTVHSDGNVGFYSAVAVNSSGTVHLAYYDEERKMWLASGRLGNWAVDDPGEPGGFYVRMRLDVTGTIHLVHGSWPAGVRYLWREAGASQFEVEGASGDEAYDIAFDLDPEGVPIICYTNAADGDVKCARRDSPSWDVLPSPPADVGLPSDLVIDSGGTLHLIADVGGYLQGDVENPWGEPELVSTAQLNALALDESGVPHVLTGGSGDEPRLHRRNGPDDWTNVTIDSTATVKGRGVLAVGPGGTFHVVYGDELTGSLKYAVRESADWAPETIDSETVLGGTGAIFVDAAGGVHVTYHDSGNKDLKYAYRCP